MTGQALERHQATTPALPTEREMHALEYQARAIAALDHRLKPMSREDRQEMALGLAVTLWSYGLPPTVVAAKHLHLIPAGKGGLDIFPGAQLLLGLLAKHGIEIRVTSNTEDLAAIKGRRPGEEHWHEVTYDTAKARRSHALDEWVERKYRAPGDQYDRKERCVVSVDGVPTDKPLPEWAAKELEAGRISRNDYWSNHRSDALLNRAIRRLAKLVGADALLGVSAPDPGDRIEPRPDDIVLDEEFGEPLDEDPVDRTRERTETAAQSTSAQVSGPAHEDTEEADPEAAHRNECTRIHVASDRIPTGTWRQLWAKAWREAGLPSALQLTEDQLEPARLLTRQYMALAALDSIGLSSKDDRHDFVSAATGGATESTKELTAEQLQAVLRAVDEAATRREMKQLAAEAAAMQAEHESQTAGEPEPEYAPGQEPF